MLCGRILADCEKRCSPTFLYYPGSPIYVASPNDSGSVIGTKFSGLQRKLLLPKTVKDSYRLFGLVITKSYFRRFNLNNTKYKPYLKN